MAKIHIFNKQNQKKKKTGKNTSNTHDTSGLCLGGQGDSTTNIFKANNFDLRTVLLELFPYSHMYVHILPKYYLQQEEIRNNPHVL